MLLGKITRISLQLTLAAVMICAAGCSGRKDGGVFRTEALDASSWDASVWISAADAAVVDGPITGDARAADGASWFVSTVRNKKDVASAKWMTTGLGVYEIYVNGRLAGDEILKPGFTHTGKTRRSFTYDISGAIDTKAGAVNELSAQVTPGWWADKIVTPAGHSGMVGRKCAFRAVLELTYSDGSKELFGTGPENWKAGIAGPVTHASIFDGEEYDARILPGYDTPEKLSAPEINTEFKGRILPSEGAEIYFRRDLALSPARIYVWKGVSGEGDDAYGRVEILREYKTGETIALDPGENLVVDFGQNCAAVPSFVFSADAGTVLECRPGELLNDGNGAKSRGMDGPEGSVHRLNLRIPDTGMILKYTFADSDTDASYCPRCTFFGYRYIAVSVSGPVKIKSVQSIPVSSVTQEMECGSITTGDESVNRLIANTLWGIWMQDMMDSQDPEGGYPGVAPLAQYGGDMMRVGWADAGIIVPWTVWKQFGDTDIIEQCWDSMTRFIDHVEETRYDHNVLKDENHNYQWADWLSYEPLESCSGAIYLRDANGKRSLRPEAVEYWNYLSASYWVIDAGMMRDMAAAIGKDSGRFEKMEAEARDYIRKNFMTADGRFRTEILNTMQTPALFALKNRIVEGEAREAMIARLKENFALHENCLQTGFLGTSILMPTLSENGMSDIAWELLFQRKNPSWLYSIDNGATTIWERWNSYMKESGMGPKGMNSFNHYAYGVVCEWLWETAAGIAADPAAPGFRHIIMKPVPDRRLGQLEAVYNSASGQIRSAWRYEGDNWIWEFTIPEGCTASVTLPGQTDSREYGAGSHEVTVAI